MRVIVHDFSGHPFQAQLSRSLAGRGYVVLHVSCTSYVSGKGTVDGPASPNLRYASVSVDEEFARYRLVRRFRQEIRYARRFNDVTRRFRPDVVVSCNDPLIAKAGFAVWAARNHVPWVFWLQDLYSIAMSREASKRSRLGAVVGAWLRAVERTLLHASDAVVVITDDFDEVLDRWGIPPEKRTIIMNWAPVPELPMRRRDNAWRAAMGLGDRFVYLYAGTLGLKHNPEVLHALAHAQPTAEVVVASQGLGADRLRALLVQQPLRNLRIIPFQPWETLPDMLGAADVLLALLEPDAGVYSVPSKILTSLCAGRPILAAIPETNLGARTIVQAGAGLVVPASEPDRFLAAARRLREDEELRGQMGMRARSYAERAFDIDNITDRFMAVIEEARGRIARAPSVS